MRIKSLAGMYMICMAPSPFPNLYRKLLKKSWC